MRHLLYFYESTHNPEWVEWESDVNDIKNKIEESIENLDKKISKFNRTLKTVESNLRQTGVISSGGILSDFRNSNPMFRASEDRSREMANRVFDPRFALSGEPNRDEKSTPKWWYVISDLKNAIETLYKTIGWKEVSRNALQNGYILKDIKPYFERIENLCELLEGYSDDMPKEISKILLNNMPKDLIDEVEDTYKLYRVYTDKFLENQPTHTVRGMK
jgi:hypothetical protein